MGRVFSHSWNRNLLIKSKDRFRRFLRVQMSEVHPKNNAFPVLAANRHISVRLPDLARILHKT